MNEILFFTETLLVVGFAFWALRLGKGALTAWVAVQALIANLFVLKQISLFGFQVTASDVFAIGSLLGLNFLQEHFGKDEANKATWVCFFYMLFFTLVSQVHLWYVPSQYDAAQPAFEAILSQSPRLLAASMGVFFIVQQVDIRFFAFLKKVMSKASFAVRSGISLVVSQFLDTVLFSFAGLYGVVASVFDVVILSYFIKLIVVFCFTTFAKAAKS